MTDALAACAAQAPWLAGLHPWGQVWVDRGTTDQLMAAWPGGSGAPRSGGGKQLRPVPAGGALGALAYETHVFATGELPTRDNAHDAYNAMVWLAWPATKQAINAAQVADATPVGSVDKDRTGSNGRTRRRDALTLLDENGALLVTGDPAFGAAWRAFDWQTLFVSLRAKWADCAECWVMGHALLDKLCAPRVAHCAHAGLWELSATEFADWRGQPLADRRAVADRWLADRVASGLSSPADLLPLPVLGVPGWWPENADSAFYNNTAVFRSQRRRQSSL